MRKIYNTTKESPISINPTETTFEIGAIENVNDNQMVGITITQTEYTQYGVRQQVEKKYFPKSSIESIITGFDLDANEPIVNQQGLQSMLTPHGITIN